jgi:hypothetical protein
MSELQESTALELVGMPAEQQQDLVTKSYQQAIQADLAEIKKLGAYRVVDHKDTEQVDKLRTSRSRVRDVRIAIEKRRKDLGQPYLEAKRAIDAVAKNMIAEITPAEEELDHEWSRVNEEIEREKQELIASRIRQLEDIGFESTKLEESGTMIYVIGDAMIPHDSIARYGDSRFGRLLRKGAKEKARILQEEEALRREKEEQERREAAEREAEKRRQQEEQAAQPPTSEPEATEPQPAAQKDEPKPSDIQPGQENGQKPKAFALGQKAALDLQYAFKNLGDVFPPKGAIVFVRDNNGTKELCLSINPDPHGTIPIPNFVSTIPVKVYL